MAELKTISSATLRLPLCQEEITTQHGLQNINQQIQQWLESHHLSAQTPTTDDTSNVAAHPHSAVTNKREVNL